MQTREILLFSIIIPLGFIIGRLSSYGYYYIINYFKKKKDLPILQDNKNNLNKQIITNETNNNNNSKLHINNIPESLLWEILYFLDIKDLLIMSQVSKKWNRITSDPYIWQNLFTNRYFDIVFEESLNWKAYYIQWEKQYRKSSNPLIFCCTYGITGSYLIKHVNEYEKEKYDNIKSPLYYAVVYSQPKVICKLLEIGYELEDYDLYLACKAESLETVKVIIEKGIDIQAIKSPMESPIHYIAEIGNIELMDFFLSNNAQINSIDWKGRTPLQISVMNGQYKMVEFLLKHGANPEVIVEYSSNEALPGGVNVSQDMVNLLAEYGSNVDPTKYHWFG